MASSFREALGFLAEIGVYDVVLPFILVFVIVFAIFEKTRIFGVYKYPNGQELPKKNLNSMAAFVIAFFVIASSQLVETITKISANMVILLIAIVFFMLLAGSFQKEDEHGFFLEGGYKTGFMILVLIGIFAIFLDAIHFSEDVTWLEQIMSWIGNFNSSESVATIILILVMLGVIMFVTGGPKASGGGNNNEHH